MDAEAQKALDNVEGSFDDHFDETTADFGDTGFDTDLEDEGSTQGQADESMDDASVDAQSTDTEEESEADADDTETVGEAEDDTEVDEAPKKEPFVPKSRLDSYRRRLREAEKRIADMEKSEDTDKTADKTEDATDDLDTQLAALTKEFAQATADADADKMADLNMQMMKLQGQKFESMLKETRTGVISESRDSVLTDTLVDELVANHDVLNPESESFDQTLVSRIEEFRAFYEHQGFTESEALVKSIEVAMPQAFDPKTDPNTKKAEQKANSLKSKVDAANRQPPNSSKSGEDSPNYGRGHKVEIGKMTLDDLDTLTDADWDEALGNNFAG